MAAHAPPRTAERTLRRLARKDLSLLCALPDEADPRTRHHDEIVRLDDLVYARADEAYIESFIYLEAQPTARITGVVANPAAAPDLRELMRQLAEAMLDRDGRLPVWWRKPLTDQNA